MNLFLIFNQEKIPLGGRRGVPCISKALTYHHFHTSGGYNNNTDDVTLSIFIELLIHRSTVVSLLIFEFLCQCYQSNKQTIYFLKLEDKTIKRTFNYDDYTLTYFCADDIGNKNLKNGHGPYFTDVLIHVSFLVM